MTKKNESRKSKKKRLDWVNWVRKGKAMRGHKHSLCVANLAKHLISGQAPTRRAREASVERAL